jgi:riboflavin kinase/FMN adenylyltransferase
MSRAVVIGALDGVHLGHAGLVKAARAAAGTAGTVTAITFDPHPLTVLRPGSAPARLSTFGQRRHWLRAAGADEVEALEPTPALLAQEPRQFVEWLVARYAPQFIVEGRDFRFGRGRVGSIETLRELEGAFGYRTVVVDDVYAPLADHSRARVTSTLVRWMLERGRVRDAALLLGHPYVVCGDVARGEGRGGRELGVPTANLGPGSQLLPADGIYAGRATGPGGERYAAAVSIGTKPTFGPHPRVCEAHLIGFAPRADEYGWTLKVEFHDWLRDQAAFASAGLLVEQIRRDIAAAREAIGGGGRS